MNYLIDLSDLLIVANDGVCAVYSMAHYTLLWLRLFFLFSNTNFQNTNKIMIKTNELRIGNYLFIPFTSENVKVTGLALKEEKTQVIYIQSNFGTSQYFALPEQYSPIELTEELLLKLGFIIFGEHKNNIIYVVKGIFLIFDKIESKYYFAPQPTTLNSPIFYYQYVHQIQNLFFSLIGEELVFSSTEP